MKKTLPIKPGSFISKEEAGMLQAVAVMLMVFHHLFGFPHRIHVPYVLVLDGFAHIETLLSYFGRICIAMFAFCSGYGLQKRTLTADTSPSEYLRGTVNRLWSFYRRLWLVALVFIPLGYGLQVYAFQGETFWKTLLALSCEYNEEWWYASDYVSFVILFPALSILMNVGAKKCPWLVHACMAVCLLAETFREALVPMQYVTPVLIFFLEGMYFVTFGWFEKLERILRERMRGLLGIALCAGVFVLRTLLVPDCLLVPGMIMGVTLIVKNARIRKWLGPALGFVGKYSTYIWLTHTFFAYYYFQEITFFPRYSPLIFLWCMGLSIGVGIVGEWIQSGLDALLRQIKPVKKEK